MAFESRQLWNHLRENDVAVKTSDYWICEVGPNLWVISEVDEDGIESFVDALRGNFDEVARVFGLRFPGRTLRAAWSDAEVA